MNGNLNQQSNILSVFDKEKKSISLVKRLLKKANFKLLHRNRIGT